MAVTAKLRWKRYVNELRFAHEELRFVKEISTEAAREFQAHYEEFCAKNNIDLRKLNENHAKKLQELYGDKAPDGANQDGQLNAGVDGALILHDEASAKSVNSDQQEEYPQQLGDYQMTQDEIEMHETFNKVFRKIAMVLHPDKLPADLSEEERNEKKQMFTDAKAALESRKYFILLDLAEKFKITIPRNYKQQIRWMKKELTELSADIQKNKNTYNYMFSECDDVTERDVVIMRFMAQIFGPEIFQN